VIDYDQKGKEIWELKVVTLDNGKILPTIVSFNDGKNFIGVDDYKGFNYVLLEQDNDKVVYSSLVFPHVMKILSKLPELPLAYEPYAEWYYNDSTSVEITAKPTPKDEINSKPHSVHG